MTPEQVTAALAARTPGPWRQTGTKSKPHWYITSDTAQVHGNFPSTREDYTPDTTTRWIADARAIVVAVTLADDLWRVAEAARAQERLTRQFVSMFGGTGRDERTILAALDTLREALAALDATREEMP